MGLEQVLSQRFAHKNIAALRNMRRLHVHPLRLTLMPSTAAALKVILQQQEGRIFSDRRVKSWIAANG